MGNLEMIPTFPLLLQKKQENKTLSGKICLLLTVLLYVRGSKIKFSKILPIKRITLPLLMKSRASLVMLHTHKHRQNSDKLSCAVSDTDC